ncbi:MAG: hypothetical protein KC589_03500 [Nanoarchaeota archaeon]|nr:hypothetical protein [Nanoarchaeota archaeon]
MKINKIVVGGLILAGIGGYAIFKTNKEYGELFQDSNRIINGRVMEEYYTESYKSPNPQNDEMIPSTYVIKIQTESRILAVSIVDSKDNTGKIINKESLDSKIENGTRISFPKGNLKHNNWLTGYNTLYYPDETFFSIGVKAGDKRADRITILN